MLLFAQHHRLVEVDMSPFNVSLAIAGHLVSLRILQKERFRWARKLQAVYQHRELNEFKPVTFHHVSRSSFDLLTNTSVNHLRLVSGRRMQVDTVLHGVLETTNTAEENDVIICGVSSELYVLKPSVVQSNYIFDLSNNTLTTKCPRRLVFQFLQSDHDEVCRMVSCANGHVEFLSPWGSPMLIEVNDYIVFEQRAAEEWSKAECDPSRLVQGFFRIEEAAFKASYEFVQS